MECSSPRAGLLRTCSLGGHLPMPALCEGTPRTQEEPGNATGSSWFAQAHERKLGQLGCLLPVQTPFPRLRAACYVPGSAGKPCWSPAVTCLSEHSHEYSGQLVRTSSCGLHWTKAQGGHLSVCPSLKPSSVVDTLHPFQEEIQSALSILENSVDELRPSIEALCFPLLIQQIA